MFKIHCPHCQHKLSADATQSGATLQCPACGVDFVIPSPTDEVVIQPQSPEDSAEATASREIQPEQSRQPESSPEPGASHSFAERLRDGYKAAQEGAKFIKKGALVGWAGLKRRSKQAALKVQIEKLRNIDLRKPYHALGKSAFEQGILADQLTERFQAIQDLDAKIAGHREKTSADAGETKMAALIRVSKDTAKSGQAQALTVKREHLITVLGREIHACKEQMSTGDLSDEFSAIDDIENRIRDKEDEVRGLNDGGKSGIQTLAVATVIGLLVIGAFYGMKMLGGGTRSGEDKATEQKKSTQDVPLTKVPEKKEEPSDARGKDLANKQRETPEAKTDSEKYLIKLEPARKGAVLETEIEGRPVNGYYIYFRKGEAKPFTGYAKDRVYELWRLMDGVVQEHWQLGGLFPLYLRHAIYRKPKQGESLRIDFDKERGVVSVKVWTPTGERCRDTNVEDGNGTEICYGMRTVGESPDQARPSSRTKYKYGEGTFVFLPEKAKPPQSASIGLNQMKREIEQEFRRIFPQAIYRDLNTEYSNMSSYVSEMIKGAAVLVDIYPERAGELQQWRNLQRRMQSYYQLKQQGE